MQNLNFYAIFFVKYYVILDLRRNKRSGSSAKNGSKSKLYLQKLQRIIII